MKPRREGQGSLQQDRKDGPVSPVERVRFGLLRKSHQKPPGRSKSYLDQDCQDCQPAGLVDCRFQIQISVRVVMDNMQLQREKEMVTAISKA